MVRGPPKKPMNEGPFVHWHRKITYLYYSTGGKDMVTITFSGDAEEVAHEAKAKSAIAAGDENGARNGHFE